MVVGNSTGVVQDPSELWVQHFTSQAIRFCSMPVRKNTLLLLQQFSDYTYCPQLWLLFFSAPPSHVQAQVTPIL